MKLQFYLTQELSLVSWNVVTIIFYMMRFFFNLLANENQGNDLKILMTDNGIDSLFWSKLQLKLINNGG